MVMGYHKKQNAYSLIWLNILRIPTHFMLFAWKEKLRNFQLQKTTKNHTWSQRWILSKFGICYEVPHLHIHTENELKRWPHQHHHSAPLGSTLLELRLAKTLVHVSSSSLSSHIALLLNSLAGLVPSLDWINDGWQRQGANDRSATMQSMAPQSTPPSSARPNSFSWKKCY